MKNIDMSIGNHMDFLRPMEKKLWPAIKVEVRHKVLRYTMRKVNVGVIFLREHVWHLGVSL